VTPERWEKIKTVFSAALAVEPADRSAFIARRCADDEECRIEVESLLAAHDGADSIPGARKAIAEAAAEIAVEQDSEYRTVLEKALAPHYEIVRQLGRGGMGAVYLAKEVALERLVAIKVLRPDLLVSVEGRERFRREARIVAQLSHPGILQLHTFGELPGVWYFVMGYVRGESLAERLNRRGRLPWVEAHRIMMEVADALDCAHRLSVIHRDIKPANVLLDEESGRSVLADFGISKMPGFSDGLTESGMVFGTPDYMSPEQTLGLSDIDERSDIYSLGAIGYVMLSGREPFAGGSSVEVMHARLLQEPADLLKLAPSVPDELAAIVMRCLSRDRANRWPDARSLREALGRVRGIADDGLPEGIKDLPSFGPYAFIWVAAWVSFALLTHRSPAERALLLLISLLVPLGLMLHVWNVGRNGIGSLQMLRVASWPPEWWGMWWPKRLRRPSDVWTRLPLPARMTRLALSGVIVLVPLIMVARERLTSAGSRVSDTVFFAIEGGMVLVAAAITLFAFVWARKQRLGAVDSARFLFGATAASPVWSESAMARLLWSSKGLVRPPEMDSPADIFRAIREQLASLAGESMEVRKAAQELADNTLRAVQRVDDALASLDRNANESEVGRLSERLAMLGGPASENTGEQRELRVLLQQQLEVVHRMRDFHQITRGRRRMHVAVLEGLWAAVSAASGRAGDATREEFGDRVAALKVQLDHDSAGTGRGA